MRNLARAVAMVAGSLACLLAPFVLAAAVGWLAAPWPFHAAAPASGDGADFDERAVRADPHFAREHDRVVRAQARAFEEAAAVRP